MLSPLPTINIYFTNGPMLLVHTLHSVSLSPESVIAELDCSSSPQSLQLKEWQVLLKVGQEYTLEFLGGQRYQAVLQWLEPHLHRLRLGFHFHSLVAKSEPYKRFSKRFVD
jgi:hypothetical protein